MAEWNELTQMTRGAEIAIERVRLVKSGVRIEGEFDLPPLARLTFEDQVFVAAFVRSHGSIKEMEASFGISYPTVKNRLNKIAGQLGFVTAEAGVPTAGQGQGQGVASTGVEGAQALESQAARLAVLDQLARREISVDAAVERLKQG